ncbi:MAG: T9SS type A sorting domain-containing protein [Bacteroidales bacterium]|jgi:hypothetical protein|nr:T9SS type A sorting domain-containing protein [Bacteroidales bacterium]
MKQISLVLLSMLFLFIQDVVSQDWYELQKLPGLYEDMSFGESVCISGDYAIVGASCRHSEKGRAFVYHFNDTIWELQGVLTTLDDEPNAFGLSVDMSGDCIVVGDICYDDNGDCRVAYVFVKPEGGWTDMTETAKLTASYNPLNDNFGFSVGISGDCVVVGAYGDNWNGIFTGAAYVYEKPDGGWIDMTETARITASDGEGGDFFGRTVSIYNEYIAIGVPRDRENGYNSGSVYIYKKPENGWENMTETCILTPTDGITDDEFGASVKIENNIIVVGAEVENWYGAAYVFEKTENSEWIDAIQTAKLRPTTGYTISNFGCSVDISGDQIIIGASGRSSNNSTGAAFIYDKPLYGWENMTETALVHPTDGSIKDYFGRAVGITDGHVIIGSVGDDDNGLRSGAVYFYSNEETSDVTEIAYQDLLLVPNPAKDSFIISSNIQKSVWIQILNSSGQEVLRKEVKLNNNRIEVSHLNSGIYFIRINIDNQTYIKKLIKY